MKKTSAEREFLAFIKAFSPTSTELAIREYAFGVAPNQNAPEHDLWNAYAYGESVKIVYIKSRKARKPPEIEPNPLFFAPNEENTRRVAKNAGKPQKSASDDGAENAERLSQSLSRSRSRVFELAACNEFRLFCTYTLDGAKRDREDLEGFRRDLGQFIRDLNRSRPEDSKIKYLAIPERHKKGGWHIHALVLGLTPDELRPFRLSEHIPERIKRTIRSGTPVYDWTAYREKFGFFTATEIRDHAATAKYVTKYLTKDMATANRAAGEHLFFASQGLKHREKLVIDCPERCPVDNLGLRWNYENDYVKVWECSLDDLNDEMARALGEFTLSGK